jgi:predicted transcriptional regulator
LPSPAPTPPTPAAPTPAAPARASEGRALEDLYARYSEARKKNNEGAVRFETLKDSVDKMMPKLREKYGDKRVDFEIVMQNGRVGLKPKVSG